MTSSQGVFFFYRGVSKDMHQQKFLLVEKLSPWPNIVKVDRATHRSPSQCDRGWTGLVSEFFLTCGNGRMNRRWFGPKLSQKALICNYNYNAHYNANKPECDEGATLGPKYVESSIWIPRWAPMWWMSNYGAQMWKPAAVRGLEVSSSTLTTYTEAVGRHHFPYSGWTKRTVYAR